jgi:hypothetical protein
MILIYPSAQPFMRTDVFGNVNRMTGTEEQVGGFDLIYRDGFVKFDPNCTVTTYLGNNYCYNGFTLILSYHIIHIV